MDDVSLRFVLKRLLALQRTLELTVPGAEKSLEGSLAAMEWLAEEVAGWLRKGDADAAEKKIIGFRLPAPTGGDR